MTSNIATVCIPVHPKHQNVLSAAIASTHAQTIPVEINVVLDKDLRGAGFARNAAAVNVETPFLTFLDADDTLAPTFIERCLETYTKGHYVYTGWIGKNKVMPSAVLDPHKSAIFNIVTTLIPTAAFRAVGGFDETLPGHEDTDLHLKLMANGICGTLVPEYLVNYSANGIRGKTFRESFKSEKDYNDFLQSVYKRYGDAKIMGCCGTQGNPVVGDPGSKQEGDVLAIAMWTGIRNQAGQGGERIYRGGNFSPIWVSPADIAARPDLFKQTYSVADLTPDKEDVLKTSGLFG